ncbi:DUF2851 family protein [Pelagicoccus mobilis]|uniref:DUF2851 family protein n=1 Tax=Pelagicoccus mobilis TaxID=415221 RepID=A0A934RUV0_9BACT|nr:DUF2851 family protein [Pelagicoccus mobilis]MBK1875251.1 DUF2851 family protein [Pelagicoccus mobilis]
MSPYTRPESVEEFHGPYGPYHVSELVLQKIWLEQAFDEGRLRDEQGRRVQVVFPGTWNRLEGPDFRGALLRVDGLDVRGDVEVHFSQADWKAHGHEENPAYDNVVLHVLYYDPGEGAPECRTSCGTVLPRVSLLPLLWYSLEEYAGDDSLVASTGVDLRPEVESLLQHDLSDRKKRLRDLAERRWGMKRHFAKLRLERLGWEGACHQSTLEVLGFARNRVPMLMIAERFGMDAFVGGKLPVDLLMGVAGNRWRLNGCRPANHPRTRLQQYMDLVSVVPAWPENLALFGQAIEEVGHKLKEEEWGTSEARMDLGIQKLRKSMVALVLGGKLGGTRLDTLICDALFPLVSARLGVDCFALWFHWPAGDRPDSCVEALKLLQVLEPRKVLMSNGWLQGVLGAKSVSNKETQGVESVQAHA